MSATGRARRRSALRPPLARLPRALRHLYWRSPFYRLGPGRARIDRPEVSWRDPWPGNADRAAQLARGEFAFADTRLQWGELDGDGDWMPLGAAPDWLAGLHAFTWLRDLRLVGSDSARQRARTWMARWIDDNTRWHPLTWRPDVVVRRITSWLGHYDFFFASADDDFRRRLLASVEAQARHLARALPGEVRGAAVIAAAKGLIAAGVALPGLDAHVTRALRHIARETESQVLPDGGHVERSPALQLSVLQDLVDIRALLLAGHQEMPEALQRAIDRMAPMLRFFRHGDGRLALFNNAIEGDHELIDLVLSLAAAKGRAPASAPYTGFQRLSAHRTLVIVDTGAPPPAGLDSWAHAGTLSFEMSVAKHRLIVNCGTHLGASPQWRRALRATAAHSTVTVADINSAELLDSDGLGRSPLRVGCTRDEANGNIWIDAEHDGYEERIGVIHRRRLYIASDGDDVRGEDILMGGPGHAFTVRFHLHPSVQASLVQNGAAALLKLPGGSGWRLRATGGRLAMQESIYLGDGLTPRHTEQVIITGTTGGEGKTVVKWAITRVKS